MNVDVSLRAVAIVALLLPGIVLALPTPGPCEMCGNGNRCHMHGTRQPAAEAHSCCGAEAETPPEPSLGSSACECGREAPPALTAEALTTIDTASSRVRTDDTMSLTVAVGAVFSFSGRPPAPQQAPPAYLIECEFLT
jgi:hypothetical protein